MLQQNIKTRRLELGLSQQELADKMHVVRQTISKWEIGLSVPDAQQLLTLSEVLEIPAAQLLDQPVNTEDTDALKLQLEQFKTRWTQLQKKRRRISRILAVLLFFISLIPLLLTALPLVQTSFSFPLGTIGEVDGPTSIFITVSSYQPDWTVSILCLLAGALISGLIFYKTKS